MLFTEIYYAPLLAVSVFVFYFIPKSRRTMYLLFISRLFILSGGLYALAVMQATSAVAYITPHICKRLVSVGKRRFILVCGCFICLLLPILSRFSDEVRMKMIPLGMMYYSLQATGYIIDSYRENSAEKSYLKIALFVGFFPATVIGPISKYKELSAEFLAINDGKSLSRGLMVSGVFRILRGYFMKLVIADRLAVFASVFEDVNAGGVALLVSLAVYSARLYADFTGGTDIALGSALLFGIKLPENFRNPLSAKSLAQFWRLWHITLGRWFSDYVFYPLSVCAPMLSFTERLRKIGNGKNTRLVRRLPLYLSSLSVWLLTGLWHGSGINFLLWGLSNCVIILISYEIKRARQKKKRVGVHKDGRQGVLMSAALIIRTYSVTSFLRLFDLYSAPTGVFTFAAQVINGLGSNAFVGLYEKLSALVIALVALLSLASAEYLKSKIESKKNISFATLLSDKPVALYLSAVFIVGIVLIFGVYGYGYESGGFIYTGF